MHSCGFDSIPYDLGALFTVQQLPEGAPIRLEGFVRVGGSFSGGTYHSTIEIVSRLRQGTAGGGRAPLARGAARGSAVRGIPGRPTTTSPPAAG